MGFWTPISIMDQGVEIDWLDPKFKGAKNLYQWPYCLENKIIKCVGYVIRENFGYTWKRLCILKFGQKKDKKITS